MPSRSPTRWRGGSWDDSFLMMVNAHHEAMAFTLPSHPVAAGWEPVVDTRPPTGKPKRRALRGGDVYGMEARSLAVLRLRREGPKADTRGDTEAMIRINTANERELLEIPGLRGEDAEAIVRFRDEHGPITDATQLAGVLGGRPLDEAMLRHIDFDPANQTAPEAPGA